MQQLFNRIIFFFWFSVTFENHAATVKEFCLQRTKCSEVALPLIHEYDKKSSL